MKGSNDRKYKTGINDIYQQERRNDDIVSNERVYNDPYRMIGKVKQGNQTTDRRLSQITKKSEDDDDFEDRFYNMRGVSFSSIKCFLKVLS